MNSIHGFYSGLLRYDIDANINTLNTIVKAILIFVLLSRLHIYGAVMATLVADILTHIIKIYYARKLYPEFKFDRKLVTLEEFRKLYAYSKHVVAMVAANSLGKSVDPLIISHFLGLSFVAIYGVATKIVLMVEQLFLSILGIFQPVFILLLEKKDDIREEVEHIFEINMFLVSIFFLPLIILSRNFFYLWLGDGFESTYFIVVAISFAYMSKAISRPVSELLLAKAKHKYLSVIRLLGAVLNVVLSIILGSIYGLIGIAIATVISCYLIDVLLHLILYKYYLKYPVQHLISNFIKMNVIIILLAYAGQLVLGEKQLTWFELALAAVGVFSLAVVIFWFSILNQDIRVKIVSFLGAKIERKFNT